MVIIPNHVLIEIAFSVYNISPVDALKSGTNGEHTDIPKARQLAFKLLRDINHLEFVELGELFNLDGSDIKRTVNKLNAHINEQFVNLRFSMHIKKYKEAIGIINEIN